MRTLADMMTIPPSTAPPLTVEQIGALPAVSIVKLRLKQMSKYTPPCRLTKDLIEVYRASGVLQSWRSISTPADMLEDYEVMFLRLPRLVCASTAEQVRKRTKTVTRRLTAPGIERGALLNLTDGARRSGVMVIGTVEVTDVRRERLLKFPWQDLEKEGFPDLTCPEFIDMFRDMHGLRGMDRDPLLYRIEFRYL